MPQSTFDATFSNASGTNANTSAMNLVFDLSGSNGMVMESAVYLVVNGTGGITIIWLSGGTFDTPGREITINTDQGMPAAGDVYNTDASQGQSGINTFFYKEGKEQWDGTGMITIGSVDQQSTLLTFTAKMAMQPDPTSPAGAMGTFNIDVNSSTAVFGL